MRRLALIALTMAATQFAAPSVAEACGGCFHAGGETESTVVTGHRMAMSISQTRSVLWDQIEYAGEPSEFSWVLPIKPGAYLEVAKDAWFDVLDAGTAAAVGSKSVSCGGGGGGIDDGGGFGCGSGDLSAVADGGDFRAGGGESDPVTVVSQATVGPYETVTLSTEEPGALNAWLDSHGYVVPEAIQPTIDAYVAEGFDFIALRLVPGNGVHQMQPVRVTMPAGQMTLPLRLVAAGTGATTSINLFVIGEGRYEVQNFPNLAFPKEEVVWDYGTSSSNYSELREAVLATEDGLGWLTSYAKQDAIFFPVNDGASEWGQELTFTSGGSGAWATTMAQAYVRAASESSNTPYACESKMMEAAQNGWTVVDNCDDEGVCAPLGPDEISMDDLICEEGADDLAVALEGLRLSDVWITRLEAELPQTAFATDLVLQAADDQVAVESRFIAPKSVNSPCGSGVSSAALAGTGTSTSRRIPGGVVVLTIGALGLALALRRRRELSDLA